MYVSHRKTIYRRQTPLFIAYACTIHKTQGLTLNSMATNLRQCFERAQGYVAISRVRTLSGFHLALPVRRNDFIKKQKDTDQVNLEIERLQELTIRTEQKYLFVE